MEDPKCSLMSLKKDGFILKDEPLSGEHHTPPGKLLLGDMQMTQMLVAEVTAQVKALGS